MGHLSQLSALRLTSALRSIRGIGSENTLIRCKNSNTKETRK